MPKANDTQHGGDHYKSDVQHWDWVAANHMDYFSGCASKYVTRWRKKDGPIALEKAGHFVVKASELHRAGLLLGAGVPCIPIEQFAAANDLTDEEAKICSALVAWRTYEDLRAVYNLIYRLWSDKDQYTVKDKDELFR
jgi:hypothetical protein